VFGTQNGCGILPLSPCEERAGREPERGVIDKKRLLSPALSSLFEEERERKCGCALKANLLPNTTDWKPAATHTYLKESGSGRSAEVASATIPSLRLSLVPSPQMP